MGFRISNVIKTIIAKIIDVDQIIDEYFMSVINFMFNKIVMVN